MSRPASRVAAVAAGVLVAVYAVRAVTGVVGGVAYSQGSRLAAEGDFYSALPRLRWAVSPQDPAALLWLRGQVRQGLWENMLDESGRSAHADQELIAAHRDYTHAIAESPASGWYLTNLGELYQDLEAYERADEPLRLDLLDAGPWATVGYPGRVAIGLCRQGIERERNVYQLHDRLALIYFENRLEELALQSVRDSARIQPIYHLHSYGDLPSLPPGLLDAFADASRSALGETPLLGQAVHLTALGQVEILRGHYAQAEQDLRAALDAPGFRLDRAEAEYYLGVALLEQGRYEEALDPLLRAAEHPNMTARSLAAQARIAERQGRLDEALTLMLRLRRVDPRNLTYILEFARLAERLERWDQAEDALKWGRIIDPEDSRPHEELFDLYLGRGDHHAAAQALDEYALVEGQDDSDVVRLRARLEARSGR